ncbi:hypothetical protein LEP1GSC168_3357 [Leptospira santarosai str. HAI134]|nr:hypothetical protein LEP1GSC168_3357 [Leptospira santarosai str. HAI134]
MIDQKILDLSPTRGGSKGNSSENIKFIAEKPLIVWTIDVVLRLKYLTVTL